VGFYLDTVKTKADEKLFKIVAIPYLQVKTLSALISTHTG
jgi:hypothetical protein